MNEENVLEENEWKVIRAVAAMILQDWQGGRGPLLKEPVPENFEELREYVISERLEAILDESIRMAEKDLEAATESLETAHRVAAAVQIDAPTAEQIDALKEDLRKISRHLQRDQRFNAAVAFAGSVAKIIDELT